MDKRLFSVILLHFLPSVISNVDDRLFNSVPRLPVWNGAPFDGSAAGGQRQMDFTKLFDLMGEPRGSRGRELSELITRPKPRCNRRIRVFNGVTRLRERGSLARFQCSHGFTLIGPTTIVCLRDQWSEPPPICVRSGCRPLRTPENGEMRQSIGGAVVAFFCHGHAQLIGNPLVFCDGTRWNGTEPVCHVEPEPTTTTTTNPPTTTPVDSEKIIDNDGILPETEHPEILQNENTPGPEVDDFAWDSNIPVATPIIPDAELPTTAHPGDFPKQSTAQPEPNQHAIGIIEITTSSPPGNDHHENVVLTSAARPAVALMTTDRSTNLNPETNTSRNEVIYAPTIAPTTTTTTRAVPKTTPLVKQTTPSGQDLPNLVTFAITTNPAPPVPTQIPIVITNRPPRIFRRTTKRPPRGQSYPIRPKYTKKPKLTPGGGRIPRPFFTRRPLRPRPTFAPPVFTTTTTTTSASDPFSLSDYPAGTDEKPFSFEFEQVEPIRPILPDQLNTKDEDAAVHHGSLFIGGIVLFAIGLSTFSAAVVFYCWRQNKGIARARPYDLDGRTLSAHDDANDDFMFIEQRDSRL